MDSNNDNARLNASYIVLSEGTSDEAFLIRLFKKHGIGAQIYVEPHEKAQTSTYHGIDAIGRWLLAITLEESYGQLRGVIIVADAADCPDQTFKRICESIEKEDVYESNSFKRPGKLNEFQEQIAHPPLAVVLLPIGGTGSLETMCVQALYQEHAWLEGPIEKLLSHEKVEVKSWPKEKQDKARVQCIIAATNRSDPVKALRYAFASKEKIFQLDSTAFSPVIDIIKRMCELPG